MSTSQDSEMPYLERFQFLRNELSRDSSDTYSLNREKLYRILDDKFGSTFDRGVAVQLYERIEKDAYNEFRIDEFVKVYLEAEDILRQKIKKADEFLIEYQRQKDEANSKLRSLSREEIVNAYGIMSGSILTIKLFEVSDIYPGSTKDVYVRITCENSTFTSDITGYVTGAKFDNEFQAEIRTGMEDIHIKVFCYKPQFQDEMLGEIIIPMSRLKDQYKHDEFFDLYDRNGHPTGGKVHLSLQWIHSKVKYLNDVVKKWSEHIRMQTEDKLDFERDLKTLYALFSGYYNALLTYGIKKPEPEPLSNSYVQEEERKKKAQKPPRKLHAGNEEVPKQIVIPQPTPVEYKPRDSVTEGLSWNDGGLWVSLAFYTSLALLALSFFSCFGKAEFLDVMKMNFFDFKLIIPLIFLMNFNHRGRFIGTTKVMLYLSLASLVSAVMSLIWIVVYREVWNMPVRGWEPIFGIFEFALILQYFHVIVKCGLMLFYFQYGRLLTMAYKRRADQDYSV